MILKNKNDNFHYFHLNTIIITINNLPGYKTPYLYPGIKFNKYEFSSRSTSMRCLKLKRLLGRPPVNLNGFK